MNTQISIASLEGSPDIIIGLVREVPPQNLKRRPTPNKWSAHEHACHLSRGDAAFLSRLELMLSDTAPYIRAMLPSPEEEAGALLNADLDEALDRYVRERAKLVTRLKGLSPEDWRRTAEHEEYSPLRRWGRPEELVRRRPVADAAGGAPPLAPGRDVRAELIREPLPADAPSGFGRGLCSARAGGLRGRLSGTFAEAREAGLTRRCSSRGLNHGFSSGEVIPAGPADELCR